MKLPCAETVNYWKTSRTSPDEWMEKAKQLIHQFGGRVLAEGYGSEPTTGQAAFMLGFEIEEDRFKILWPVLPTKKKGEERAARIQAATMLYHEVKSRCLAATVLGARAAFFSYLMLPDGRTASQASIPELTEGIPRMLLIE